ncbi:MAG: hypothetical protein Kow0068_04740 [Marinilabiliales bacterium]
MKTVLLVISVFVSITSAYNQKYQKGNYNGSFGTGFYIGGVSTDKEEIDANNSALASFIYPVDLTYFITDRWAVGVNYETQILVMVEDNKNIRGRIHSEGISLKYLTLNKEKNNISFNFNYGFSTLKWHEKTSNEALRANGSYLLTGITYQHYYSNLVGIFFGLDLLNINYSYVRNKRDEYLTYDYGANLINISVTGAKISAGLCLKF